MDHIGKTKFKMAKGVITDSISARFLGGDSSRPWKLSLFKKQKLSFCLGDIESVSNFQFQILFLFRHVILRIFWYVGSTRIATVIFLINNFHSSKGTEHTL